MEIGPKSIEAMKQMAENQIDMHADKMNLAWLKSEDGKLKVTMAFDVAVSQVAQDPEPPASKKIKRGGRESVRPDKPECVLKAMPTGPTPTNRIGGAPSRSSERDQTVHK